MQHTEDRKYLGKDGVEPSNLFLFRYRGFRTDQTLGDHCAPALILPNANDPLRRREESKKLFPTIT